MTDLNIALILRLVDRATGPARDALRQVERVSDRMGRRGLETLDLADRMNAASAERRSALRDETMELAGMALALYGLTEPAIQSEALLAEVGKAVSFQSETGLAQLHREAMALVTSDGLNATADGILEIVAAAGRMGVVDENLPDDEKRAALLQFATDAAKMALAFGTSADDAGTTLARWRENLSLSHDDAMLMADMVNVLGNSFATNERDILSVINRQGVLAKQSGLATDEIVALSTALLDAGSSPEIAATGMKNFINALTRGESATSRQKDVLKEIGIDGEELARTMQEDASAGIFAVLDALNQIEPYRQTSLVGDLFGEEGKAAIIPLIANADRLREALSAVADETEILGSMEAEYQLQASTTKAARQQTLQYFVRLSNIIGSQLLPMLNEMLETITPAIEAAIAWAEANPELIQQIGWLTVSLFAAKAGLLAMRWAFEPVLAAATLGIRAFGWLQIALGFAGKVLVWLGRLFLTNPIGLAVAGIALAATLIYKHWDEIVPWFQKLFKAWKDIFGGLIEFVVGVFTLDFGAAAEGLMRSWDGVKDYFDTLLSGISGAFQAALGIIQPVIDAMKWVDERGSGTVFGDADATAARLNRTRAMTATENSDYPGSPSFQNRFLNGRALGGGVRAGHVYQINELGQELFAPGASGRMITARDARASSGASRGGSPVTVGDIHIHPPAGADARAIARAVKDALRDALDQSHALHDGGFHA